MGTTSSTNCSNNGVMLDFGSIPDDLLRIILTLCNDPATFMRAGWVNKRYNTFVKSAWQDLAKLTGLTRRANDREAVVAATIAHSNLANVWNIVYFVLFFSLRSFFRRSFPGFCSGCEVLSTQNLTHNF
jgi:hypothetical protein